MEGAGGGVRNTGRPKAPGVSVPLLHAALAARAGETLHGLSVLLGTVLGAAYTGNVVTGQLHAGSTGTPSGASAGAQLRAEFIARLAGSAGRSANGTRLLSSPLHRLGILLSAVLGTAYTGNAATAEVRTLIGHEG
jgi:hypothetical protein